MRPIEVREYSPYAKFYMTFQGYLFFDKKLNRIRAKYVLWNTNRALCLIMTQKKAVVSRFRLVDKEGWKNGKYLKDETNKR